MVKFGAKMTTFGPSDESPTPGEELEIESDVSLTPGEEFELKHR